MALVEFLKGLPDWLIIIITAAVPVIEVRGSVPLGILYFKMNPLMTVFLSSLGSTLPALPVLWLLKNMTGQFRKINVLDRFLGWLFTRTKKKSKIIEDLKLIGLMIFVGIPFPGTGVWSGCVAAYLLDLEIFPAFAACTAGTIIASLLMMAAALGIARLP